MADMTVVGKSVWATPPPHRHFCLGNQADNGTTLLGYIKHGCCWYCTKTKDANYTVQCQYNLLQVNYRVAACTKLVVSYLEMQVDVVRAW